MEPTNLTIEILKQIRDEGRKTNERLETVERGFTELHSDFQELQGDVRRTEIRLATELVAVAGAVREVRDLLRDDRVLRDRVDDHERRLVAVEHRTG